MKMWHSNLLFALLVVFGLLISGCSSQVKTDTLPPLPTPTPSLTPPPVQGASPNFKLPEPRLKSEMSLEEALLKRRSVRQYSDSPLKVSEVSQILWAAQGITDAAKGGRTAPSAVAIYPLEVYIIVRKVENLEPGIYLYQTQGHELVRVKDGEVKETIVSYKAAVDIVIAANYEKVPKRFGENSTKWVYLEGGHVAQNICLQATALNLGTVTIGGFREDQVKSVLGLTADRGVLYVLPVGKKT